MQADDGEFLPVRRKKSRNQRRQESQIKGEQFERLKSMFSNIDEDVIQMVFQQNKQDEMKTIEILSEMESQASPRDNFESISPGKASLVDLKATDEDLFRTLTFDAANNNCPVEAEGTVNLSDSQ